MLPVIRTPRVTVFAALLSPRPDQLVRHRRAARFTINPSAVRTT